MGREEQDLYFMRLALEEAGLAFSEGEVPVGAVLVGIDGALLSRAHNKRETHQDPTAHAEVAALRKGAGIVHSWRLSGTTLYVTKEPCIMCAGTMINARISRLVYGCHDSKGGAVGSLYTLLVDKRLNHQVDVVSGVLEEECASILRKFFEDRR